MAISQDVVRIVIMGLPQPYTERTVVRTRKGPNGERIPIIKNGHPVVGSWKPQHVGRYQDHVRRAAEDAMAGRPLFAGPVCLAVRAYMPIPQSMLKRDRILADRELLPHTKKPDLDNLIKAAMDGLTGRVWQDDNQVAVYDGTFKAYSKRPRLEIEVRAITSITEANLALDDENAAPFVRFVQGTLL